MNYKQTFPKIKQTLPIDNSIISSLYTLAVKSQLTALVFVVLVAIFLYSELSYSIVIWGSVLFVFTLCRLYSIYLFKTAHQMYSVEIWYKFFMISSCTLGVAVAVNPIIGISAPKRLTIDLKFLYSGLKSCPHSEMQCASSTATKDNLTV